MRPRRRRARRRAVAQLRDLFPEAEDAGLCGPRAVRQRREAAADHLLVMELTGGSAFELPSRPARRAEPSPRASSRCARCSRTWAMPSSRTATTVRPRHLRHGGALLSARPPPPPPPPPLPPAPQAAAALPPPPPLLGFHLRRRRFRRRRRRRRPAAAAARGRRGRLLLGFHPPPAIPPATPPAAVSPEPDSDSALLRRLFEEAGLAQYLYKFEQQFDLESPRCSRSRRSRRRPQLDHRAASILHDALKPCAAARARPRRPGGAFVRASIDLTALLACDRADLESLGLSAEQSAQLLALINARRGALLDEARKADAQGRGGDQLRALGLDI